MTNVKIGDLYSLQNHPYGLNSDNIKISALASMTPPILVISEIMNSHKEYDSETGKIKPRLVKCIFYSHKSHKFENSWFDIQLLKPLVKEESAMEVISESNGEIKTSDNQNGVNLGLLYSLTDNLSSVKTNLIHSQVILKSCDNELGKMKTTFFKTDNKSSQKVNSHLDFLPPVLIVIDVKLNDDKALYNPKSGNLRKITSAFLLKCKWYNPSTGSFSEDFIPIDVVKKIEKIDTLEEITHYIKNKYFFRNEFNKHIELDGGEVINHTYIQPLELIFNHYQYKLKYFDFFKTKYSEINLSEISLFDEYLELYDFIEKKIPSYDTQNNEFTNVKDFNFIKNNYYRITYKDLQDRITKRVILVKEFVKDKVVIADCLLRNGEERHFRIKQDGILKIEILNQKYFQDKI